MIEIYTKPSMQAWRCQKGSDMDILGTLLVDSWPQMVE